MGSGNFNGILNMLNAGAGAEHTDLMKMLGDGFGGSLMEKAGDLLRGGLGNLFKQYINA